MTLQEFTDRTGLTPSATEFETIHEIYMADANMDKDTFCKEWVKASKNEVFKTAVALHQAASDQAKRYSTMLKEERASMDRRLEHLGQCFADEAHKYSSAEARGLAIELLGRKGYARYIISKEYSLWDDDKSLIFTLLCE